MEKNYCSTEGSLEEGGTGPYLMFGLIGAVKRKKRRDSDRSAKGRGSWSLKEGGGDSRPYFIRRSFYPSRGFAGAAFYDQCRERSAPKKKRKVAICAGRAGSSDSGLDLLGRTKRPLMGKGGKGRGAV